MYIMSHIHAIKAKVRRTANQPSPTQPYASILNPKKAKGKFTLINSAVQRRAYSHKDT
jgi:hypothetical protein